MEPLRDTLPGAWARLKQDVSCGLRRGAWYRVVGLTPEDAVLQVRNFRAGSVVYRPSRTRGEMPYEDQEARCHQASVTQCVSASATIRNRLAGPHLRGLPDL